MGCDGLDEQLVEVRRRYAPPPLGRDRDRVGERLLPATPGLRRDEAMAQPGREVELPRDLTLDRRGRLRTAVDEVPLVHGEHEADEGLEGVAGDVHVLGGQAFRRVREEDRDVGPLERPDGAEQRELLDPLVDAPPPADPRGVHEHDPPALALDDRVDRVARGPRLLVRPAEDGDAYVGRLRRRLLLLRQPRDDRVEQVAGAGALDRRDRVEVSEPERIELRGLRLAPPGVGLVRREHHRLTAAAEAVGDVVLDGDDPGLRVDDEEHDVGLVDRGLRLAAHGVLEILGGFSGGPRPPRIDEAAGVDERELAAAPLRRRVEAVARRSGLVLDDRDAVADEAVEERRLPDVGSPDDRDESARHGGKPRRRSPPPAPSLR